MEGCAPKPHSVYPPPPQPQSVYPPPPQPQSVYPPPPKPQSVYPPPPQPQSVYPPQPKPQSVYPPQPQPQSVYPPPPKPQSVYPPPPKPQSVYPPPPQPQSVYPPPPKPQSVYPPPSQPQSVYPPPPKPQSVYPPPPQPKSVYPPPPQQQCQPSSPPTYPYPSTVDIPSSFIFPPGTNPNAVACFQLADQDHDGIISDKDLQRALSLNGHPFQSRTVHLLIAIFTNWSTVKRLGPKEFIPLYNNLLQWKEIFERFDVDHSEKIELKELENALRGLGYGLGPQVLDRLMAKFGKGPTKSKKAIDYSYFIECCLTVKGLTDAFNAKDTAVSGSVTFGIESFMLTILPFMASIATDWRT